MSSNSTCTNATLFENAYFVGMNLQNILYGIELVLYFKTMYIYASRRRTKHRLDMFYALFSTVIFIFITIWVSTNAIFAQRMWLIHRDFPGGSIMYGITHTSAVYMDFGTVSSILLQSMTDALMLFRCRVVWGSRRIVIVPSIIWSANFVLGILLIWQSCTPGTNFFTGLAAKLGLSYYTVSVSLNVFLTSMICLRLIRHAMTIKEYLGEQHASPYISIVIIFVESVLPYTLCGIAFLVAYGLKSQLAIGFSCVYTLMMAVSPQMLIVRVAEGKAWEKDTMKEPTLVMASSSAGRGNTSEGTRSEGGEAMMVHLETKQSSEESERCKV